MGIAEFPSSLRQGDCTKDPQIAIGTQSSPLKSRFDTDDLTSSNTCPASRYSHPTPAPDPVIASATPFDRGIYRLKVDALPERPRFGVLDFDSRALPCYQRECMRNYNPRGTTVAPHSQNQNFFVSLHSLFARKQFYEDLWLWYQELRRKTGPCNV
jgi:hypothetical protein